MLALIIAYWPHILAVLSVLMGTVAAVHATMTKEEVRSALGWVGVIVLSPIVGAVIYAIAGINRIRRSNITQQRSFMQDEIMDRVARFDAGGELVAERFGRRFAAMKVLGDRVTRHALTTGNSIEPIATGDAAYAAMLEAIEQAKRSIILETYIFDNDRIGARFVSALQRAKQRGVEVRVLIDAVGARYSVPSILPTLRERGIVANVFNGNVIMGLRLPYANLRTHRKILVVDGRVAFSGGMNIREGFTEEFGQGRQSHDTHFKISGPVVADFLHCGGRLAFHDKGTSGYAGLGYRYSRRRAGLADRCPRLLLRAGQKHRDQSQDADRRFFHRKVVDSHHVALFSPGSGAYFGADYGGATRRRR